MCSKCIPWYSPYIIIFYSKRIQFATISNYLTEIESELENSDALQFVLLDIILYNFKTVLKQLVGTFLDNYLFSICFACLISSSFLSLFFFFLMFSLYFKWDFRNNLILFILPQADLFLELLRLLGVASLWVKLQLCWEFFNNILIPASGNLHFIVWEQILSVYKWDI